MIECTTLILTDPPDEQRWIPAGLTEHCHEHPLVDPLQGDDGDDDV